MAMVPFMRTILPLLNRHRMSKPSPASISQNGLFNAASVSSFSAERYPSWKQLHKMMFLTYTSPVQDHGLRWSNFFEMSLPCSSRDLTVIGILNTPFRMKLEDFDTLDSSINLTGEPELIGMVITANHCVNLLKTFSKLSVPTRMIQNFPLGLSICVFATQKYTFFLSSRWHQNKADLGWSHPWIESIGWEWGEQQHWDEWAAHEVKVRDTYRHPKDDSRGFPKGEGCSKMQMY